MDIQKVERKIFLNSLMFIFLTYRLLKPIEFESKKTWKVFLHIYFYRPYIYNGSALAWKVEYNDEKFINLKTNSYYLKS